MVWIVGKLVYSKIYNLRHLKIDFDFIVYGLIIDPLSPNIF